MRYFRCGLLASATRGGCKYRRYTYIRDVLIYLGIITYSIGVSTGLVLNLTLELSMDSRTSCPVQADMLTCTVC